LPVTTVVVVPVTVELEFSGGRVAVAGVTVTVVDEIVANGWGVASTDVVSVTVPLPFVVLVVVEAVVVAVFAAAEGDGAAVAVDEPLVKGGDVAAPELPELDEPEPELAPELEMAELDVDEPEPPAPDAVVADVLDVLPRPLESDSA
jgi:hypothetical protein